jgi:hypothetical protein
MTLWLGQSLRHPKQTSVRPGEVCSGGDRSILRRTDRSFVRLMFRTRLPQIPTGSLVISRVVVHDFSSRELDHGSPGCAARSACWSRSRPPLSARVSAPAIWTWSSPMAHSTGKRDASWRARWRSRNARWFAALQARQTRAPSELITSSGDLRPRSTSSPRNPAQGS